MQWLVAINAESKADEMGEHWKMSMIIAMKHHTRQSTPTISEVLRIPWVGKILRYSSKSDILTLVIVSEYVTIVAINTCRTWLKYGAGTCHRNPHLEKCGYSCGFKADDGLSQPSVGDHLKVRSAYILRTIKQRLFAYILYYRQSCNRMVRDYIRYPNRHTQTMRCSSISPTGARLRQGYLWHTLRCLGGPPDCLTRGSLSLSRKGVRSDSDDADFAFWNCCKNRRFQNTGRRMSNIKEALGQTETPFSRRSRVDVDIVVIPMHTWDRQEQTKSRYADSVRFGRNHGFRPEFLLLVAADKPHKL